MARRDEWLRHPDDQEIERLIRENWWLKTHRAWLQAKLNKARAKRPVEPKPDD